MQQDWTLIGYDARIWPPQPKSEQIPGLVNFLSFKDWEAILSTDESWWESYLYDTTYDSLITVDPNIRARQLLVENLHRTFYRELEELLTLLTDNNAEPDAYVLLKIEQLDSDHEDRPLNVQDDLPFSVVGYDLPDYYGWTVLTSAGGGDVRFNPFLNKWNLFERLEARSTPTKSPMKSLAKSTTRT